MAVRIGGHHPGLSAHPESQPRQREDDEEAGADPADAVRDGREAGLPQRPREEHETHRGRCDAEQVQPRPAISGRADIAPTLTQSGECADGRRLLNGSPSIAGANSAGRPCPGGAGSARDGCVAPAGARGGMGSGRHPRLARQPRALLRGLGTARERQGPGPGREPRLARRQRAFLPRPGTAREPQGPSPGAVSRRARTGRYNSACSPHLTRCPRLVLLVAGGALACFLGYRLFRVVLGIYGFALGALLATSVLAPTETTTTLFVAIAGGLAGALVLIGAYFVGVAFAGAALAALLVHVAWSQFSAEPHPIAVIAGCIAGALLSLALQRYVIVFGTAFGGAWTLLVGVLTAMGRGDAAAAAKGGDAWLTYPLNPAPGERWVPIAWIVLGSIGTLVQLGWTGGRKAGRRRRARKAA